MKSIDSGPGGHVYLPVMTRMPLNLLPAFVAVAELQNVRAAAEKLHLTHSALSQQIAVLEARLGFQLFDRHARRLVLNPAGEALLKKVVPALDIIHEGIADATRASSAAETHLRIAMSPTFANRWFLPRIERWRSRYPRITLDIDASQRAVDIAREGFHAGIRNAAGPWPGLTGEPLYGEPTKLVVVASPETAARLARQPADALTQVALLGDRELWRCWFSAAGLIAQPEPVMAFNDIGLMLQAAEQGLGLALARVLYVSDALDAGRLVKISSVSITHELALPHSIVYAASLEGWAPLQAFREWLKAELRETLQQPV
ncbi:LysR substrate-binding domain-containing protein [Paraburkholderia acidicola]|uniref:LysR substrate-binding domain-containing protein n=1 Tax=Paraburkholderia acidicola TaxID=1912599 RepID=A0ABV1LR43_9BURK